MQPKSKKELMVLNSTYVENFLLIGQSYSVTAAFVPGKLSLVVKLRFFVQLFAVYGTLHFELAPCHYSGIIRSGMGVSMVSSQNTRNGFTLIELLMSLGLITIVAAGTSALLISQYRMNSSTERKVQLQDHLSLVKLALSNKNVCVKAFENVAVTEVKEGTVSKGFSLTGDAAKGIQVFLSVDDANVSLKAEQQIPETPGAITKKMELIGVGAAQDVSPGVKKAVGRLQVEIEMTNNAMGSATVKRNIPLSYQFNQADGKIIECEATNTNEVGASCEQLGLVAQADGTCKLNAAAVCTSLGLTYNTATQKCDGLVTADANGSGTDPSGDAKFVECPAVITAGTAEKAFVSCFAGREATLSKTNSADLSPWLSTERNMSVVSQSEGSQIRLRKNSSGSIEVVLSNRITRFERSGSGYKGYGDGSETPLCTLDPVTSSCHATLKQRAVAEHPSTTRNEFDVPWNITVSRDGIRMTSGCVDGYTFAGIAPCGSPAARNAVSFTTNPIWTK